MQHRAGRGSAMARAKLGGHREMQNFRREASLGVRRIARRGSQRREGRCSGASAPESRIHDAIVKHGRQIHSEEPGKHSWRDLAGETRRVRSLIQGRPKITSY
ncbi:hypothetical protein K0M31_011314 [Melipona bicolor]|uniref:Uncharacterized protein n=1 Tax=Melipona bicolor TaxID=60889 RepID=A0AA40G9B6_9HYME|nr:hypothetical protein K0M31_011314 [Melipona bicolor]